MKFADKKTGIIISGLISCLAFSLLGSTKQAWGFDRYACVNAAYGVGGNNLMINACNDSVGYGNNYSPGVGWINNYSGYNTSPDVDLTTSRTAWSGTVSIYMHAAQYNYNKYPFKAANILLCTGESGWGSRKVTQDGKVNPCSGYSKPDWVISYVSEFTRATEGGMGKWSTCSNAACGGEIRVDLAKFRASAGCSELSQSCTNTVYFGRNGGFVGSGYAAEKISVTIRISPPSEQTTSTSGRTDPTASASITGMAYIGESGSANVGSISLGGSESKVRKTEVRFYVNGANGASRIPTTRTITADSESSVRQAICNSYASSNKGYCESDSVSDKSKIKVPNNGGYVGGKVCVAQAKDGKHWTTTTKKVPTTYDSKNNKWNYKTTTTSEEAWNNSWSVAISCIPIAKKMNVAVTGSGVYANGGIITATERKHNDAGNKVFGSWSEFMAITGSGKITGDNNNLGFSSGSGLANGLSSSETTKNTNTYSPESAGNETMDGYNIPAAGVSSSSSSFISALENSVLRNGSSSNAEVHRTCEINSNVEANSTDVRYYKQKIYYCENGNLTIASNVSQINAWIIVKNGKMDTCKDGDLGGIDANQCNKQLVINGLVYAQGVNFDRTYGGLKNDYAEIINLTPMSYVWAYNQASSTYANPTTVYTRELAPRT